MFSNWASPLNQPQSFFFRIAPVLSLIVVSFLLFPKSPTRIKCPWVGLLLPFFLGKVPKNFFFPPARLLRKVEAHLASSPPVFFPPPFPGRTSLGSSFGSFFALFFFHLLPIPITPPSLVKIPASSPNPPTPLLTIPNLPLLSPLPHPPPTTPLALSTSPQPLLPPPLLYNRPPSTSLTPPPPPTPPLRPPSFHSSPPLPPLPPPPNPTHPPFLRPLLSPTPPPSYLPP